MNIESTIKEEQVSTISNTTFLILLGRGGKILILKFVIASFPC
jgi:hypothetical protein